MERGRESNPGSGHPLKAVTADPPRPHLSDQLRSHPLHVGLYLLSVQDTAAYLGVTRAVVYGWLRAGQLPAVGPSRLPLAALVFLVRQHEHPGTCRQVEAVSLCGRAGPRQAAAAGALGEHESPPRMSEARPPRWRPGPVVGGGEAVSSRRAGADTRPWPRRRHRRQGGCRSEQSSTSCCGPHSSPPAGG